MLFDTPRSINARTDSVNWIEFFKMSNFDTTRLIFLKIKNLKTFFSICENLENEMVTRRNKSKRLEVFKSVYRIFTPLIDWFSLDLCVTDRKKIDVLNSH